MYRNATDFCILILYPETLPNLLVSSSSFLVACLQMFMYSISHILIDFLKNFVFGCTGSLLLHRLFSNCGERDYSLVAVLALLVAVACLVAEHGC